MGGISSPTESYLDEEKNIRFHKSPNGKWRLFRDKQSEKNGVYDWYITDREFTQKMFVFEANRVWWFPVQDRIE